MTLSLQEAFSSLKDPRIERHKGHQLLDIIILTICAVISGAEGWETIEVFGKEKQDWLRKRIGWRTAHVTAIPALLDKDCIITIDTMGCHLCPAGKPILRIKSLKNKPIMSWR